MKRRYPILFTAVVAALPLLVNCSKPDRSEEAKQLKLELQDQLFSNPEQALARVDSAERAGVFSETTANLIRSNVYGQMGKTQLAVFYGGQINPTQLRDEGVNYYSALLNLTSLLNKSGEWGKALHLADEMIADVDKGDMDEQVALRVTCTKRQYYMHCSQKNTYFCNRNEEDSHHHCLLAGRHYCNSYVAHKPGL